MIKSSSQLRKAEERLNAVKNLLSEYSEKYSELEFEFYSRPLIIEENSLLDQIIEYKQLKELPFAEAINSLFSKPILIDNIAELLSKLRIAAKLSQADMAQRLGWEQSNLSRFESENYSSQTVNKIVEYASLLGVWLHVIPSLTEEVEIKREGKRMIKTYEPDFLDVVSTSTNYGNDSTSDSLQTEKPADKKQDYISI